MNRSLLVAAFVAVGLTACGEKPAPPAPPPPVKEAPKVTPAPSEAPAPAPDAMKSEPPKDSEMMKKDSEMMKK